MEIVARWLDSAKPRTTRTQALGDRALPDLEPGCSPTKGHGRYVAVSLFVLQGVEVRTMLLLSASLAAACSAAQRPLFVVISSQ